jgi:predicted O-methyltransferase YrrM
MGGFSIVPRPWRRMAATPRHDVGTEPAIPARLGTQKYEFGEDWFSMRIPTFEKLVAPLAGSPCQLLEIGPYEGRSTTWLIDNVLTNPKSRLDSIDLHIRDELRRNVERTGRSAQVTLHEGNSRDILGKLRSNTYDFAYVDGSHWTLHVIEDAVAAFRLAKVGGLVGFDDYLWDVPPLNVYGTPKPALDAFLSLYAGSNNRYHPLVERIDIEDVWQIWIRKMADIPVPKRARVGAWARFWARGWANVSVMRNNQLRHRRLR